MAFPRQEYGSGLTFPPPGDLLDPGIEPTSLVSLASVDAISELAEIGMRVGGKNRKDGTN